MSLLKRSEQSQKMFDVTYVLCFKSDTYPYSRFREVGPHGDLLSCAHVRIAVSLKGGF